MADEVGVPVETPVPTADEGRAARKQVGLIAIAIMGVHLLARFGGLIQKIVLARFFGTTAMADAATGLEKIFQAIYYIPEELLTHSLLPVFTRERQQHSEDAAWRLASLTGTLQAVLLVLVTLIGTFGSQWLVGSILGRPDPSDLDFAKAQEKFELTAYLVQVAMLGLFCTSLGSLTYVILNSYKRFVSPALGDVAQKLGIVVGTVVMCVGFGAESPIGYAIGFILGGVLKLLTHLVALRPKLRLARPGFDFRNPALRELGVLMLPLLGGSLISKGRDLLEARIAWAASAAVEGTIASLDYARKIVWMPVNIIPYALGIALFPFLAEWALKNDKPQVTRAFLTASRTMIFLFVPLTVASLLLGRTVIEVLYEGGRFKEGSVDLTTAAFLVYAAGMTFYALEIIALQVFYAHRNTRTPFWVGLFASVVHLLIAWAAGLQLGLGNVGIALGFTVAKTAKVLVMWALLRPVIEGYNTPSLLVMIAKTVGASLLLGAAIYGTQQVLPQFLDLHRKLHLVAFLLATSAVGVVVFAAAAAALKMEEMTLVTDRLLRKLRRQRAAA
ncbi:MAG: murein biosynthesis integral membrane protein MurJ [Fimbriimonadaceae bacterium]|nr:murein biosynthesis integral membrane protein MurJ [Fimbriimonadaceae bacterium]